MIKKSKFDKGYTLIELLAVMLIMITVGLIIATILVSSLRGSNKTNTVNTLRQNGNYAILQISKMLEFAQSFGGVSSDGSTYTSSCTSPTTQYKYIKITSFDNGNTVFFCDVSNSKISSISASFNGSIVNPNDVNLSQCYFTCSRNISVPPTIGINFTLTQKGSSGLFEKKETINFQTSVIMRNLNK